MLRHASSQPLTLAPAPQRVTIESAIADSELSSSVHPAVLQLGLRYADGSIRGGNARCVAMLTTFRKVIQVSRSRACCGKHCVYLCGDQRFGLAHSGC